MRKMFRYLDLFFQKVKSRERDIVAHDALNESTNCRLRKEVEKKVKREKRDLIVLNSVP